MYSTSGVLLLISHAGRGPHRDAATSVRKGKYLAFPANNTTCRLLFPYQLPRGADPEPFPCSGLQVNPATHARSICHSLSPVLSRAGTAAPGLFCPRVPRDAKLFNDDVRFPSKGQLPARTSPIADPSELPTWAQTLLLCSVLHTDFPSHEEQTCFLPVSSLWENNC